MHAVIVQRMISGYPITHPANNVPPSSVHVAYTERSHGHWHIFQWLDFLNFDSYFTYTVNISS